MNQRSAGPPRPLNNAEEGSIVRTYLLPDPQLEDHWRRIYVSQEVKETLMRYLNVLAWLSGRGAVAMAFALCRALLLYGPPGSGKSSLVLGLPNHWAKVSGQSAQLLVLDTHTLRNEKYGEHEKRVRRAFQQIEECASTGLLTFVVIDEVESIASDRASISTATNPHDALHAVNAFLEALDRISREHPNVVFLVTSNFPVLIDRAFADRVDFALEIGLPDAEHRSLVLEDVLLELNRLCEWDAAQEIITHPDWAALLAATAGFSARQLRHLIIVALSRLDLPTGGPKRTVAFPTAPIVRELLQAAHEQVAQLERHTATGGVYVHDYQRRGTQRDAPTDNDPIVRVDRPAPRTLDQPLGLTRAAAALRQWRNADPRRLTTTLTQLDRVNGRTAGGWRRGCKSGQHATPASVGLAPGTDDPGASGAVSGPPCVAAFDREAAAPKAAERSSEGNERRDTHQRMVAARHVTVVPKRGPQEAWSLLERLLAETLAARGYMSPQDALGLLAPLRLSGEMLLITRALERGYLELSDDQLVLRVTFGFTLNGSTDSLAVPVVTTLAPPGAEESPCLTIATALPVADQRLRSALEEVNAAGILTVRFQRVGEDG